MEALLDWAPYSSFMRRHGDDLTQHCRRYHLLEWEFHRYRCDHVWLTDRKSGLRDAGNWGLLPNPASFTFSLTPTFEAGGPNYAVRRCNHYSCGQCRFWSEGNGVVQFTGSISSLTWTNTFENFYGFTVVHSWRRLHRPRTRHSLHARLWPHRASGHKAENERLDFIQLEPAQKGCNAHPFSCCPHEILLDSRGKMWLYHCGRT